MTDTKETLGDMSCFAQYVSADNGVAGPSLPSDADVGLGVDNFGGHVWVSVFCSSAKNIAMGGSGTCQTSATVRFENCATQ